MSTSKDLTPEPIENTTVMPFSAVPTEDPPGINVGNLGHLSVPSEDIGTDEGGHDVDFTDSMTAKIDKPRRQEWIAFLYKVWMSTRLLLAENGPNRMDVAHHYVREGAARQLIRDELTDVKVVLYYSFTNRCWKLWIVRVTESGWYQSLEPLFEQDADFYQDAAFRIFADRSLGRYRIRTKPAPGPLPKAPAKPIGDMLGEALGPMRFIDSPEHPAIRDLIAGEEF